MDKRKIEIIIAILVILGVIVLLWLLLRGDNIGQDGRQDQPEPVEADDLFFEEPVVNADPIIMPQPIARTFVERFGSFSTEADYSNVDDVLNIVTADLRLSLLDIAEAARAEQSGAYYGVSTSVITMNTLNETEEVATIQVKTQRIESFGSPGNTQSRYQDIELRMVKQDGNWLISSFTWR